MSTEAPKYSLAWRGNGVLLYVGGKDGTKVIPTTDPSRVLVFETRAEAEEASPKYCGLVCAAMEVVVAPQLFRSSTIKAMVDREEAVRNKVVRQVLPALPEAPFEAKMGFDYSGSGEVRYYAFGKTPEDFSFLGISDWQRVHISGSQTYDWEHELDNGVKLRLVGVEEIKKEPRQSVFMSPELQAVS